jgi:hypothetical protein
MFRQDVNFRHDRGPFVDEISQTQPAEFGTICSSTRQRADAWFGRLVRELKPPNGAMSATGLEIFRQDAPWTDRKSKILEERVVPPPEKAERRRTG